MRETVDAFTTDRIVVNDPDQLASLSSRKAVKLSLDLSCFFQDLQPEAQEWQSTKVRQVRSSL